MTMDLVKCGSCSAAISAGADKCPKCGARNAQKPVEMMACRACGAMLEKAAHRRSSVYAGGVYKGTSQYHWSLDHSPCPQCGEPKPLLRNYDVQDNRFMFLTGPVILLSLFWFLTYVGVIPPFDPRVPLRDAHFSMQMAIVGIGSVFLYLPLMVISGAGMMLVKQVQKHLSKE